MSAALKTPRWARPDMAARVDRDRLDQLADLIGDGATITAAAHALGVSMQRGSQMFKRIRDELGWQAV